MILEFPTLLMLGGKEATIFPKEWGWGHNVCVLVFFICYQPAVELFLTSPIKNIKREKKKEKERAVWLFLTSEGEVEGPLEYVAKNNTRTPFS